MKLIPEPKIKLYGLQAKSRRGEIAFRRENDVVLTPSAPYHAKANWPPATPVLNTAQDVKFSSLRTKMRGSAF